jgi:hypothetical protein
MKKIHYKNIGLPKTGTTWLWLQLSTHPDIDMFTTNTTHQDPSKPLHTIINGEVMPNRPCWTLKEQKYSSKEEYLNFYSKYDISVHFDTWFFKDSLTDINSWQNEINKESSHISVSLRNPYDLLNSWYNFFEKKNNKINKTFSHLANPTFFNLVTYKKMFEELSLYKNKIKVLFYDDMKNDHEKYLKEVYDFIGISYNYYPMFGTKIMLPTSYVEQLTITDEGLIMHINENICRIEDFTHRDLSHWKKNT